MATGINPFPLTRNRIPPNRPQPGVAGRRAGRTIRGLLSIALLCCSVAQLHSAQADDKPARGVSDPGVVTTRQNITPAGVQTVFRGRVYGVTFGSTPSEIWALLGRVPQRKAHQVCRLDWQNNRLLGSSWIEGYAEPGLQGIVYDRMSSRVFVGATAGGSSSSAFKNLVRLLSFPEQGDPSLSEDLGRWNCGAPAIASKRNGRGQRIAVVPLIANNELAIVDVETMKLAGKVKTGVAPFGAGINADGSVAYVTNWGGRTPSPQDLTATTGIAPNADRVVVDERGIAATGSVMRVDLVKLRVTDTIPVELHPTAVVLDEARNALYVANSNSDSVSRIDTARNTVTHTIPLQPFRQKVNGVAPTALAISEDGTRLYAACGGINAVAVIDSSNIEVEGPAVANRNWEILGMIPTAFYPNGLSLSRDGEFLAVSTLLGVGLGKLEQPDKGMYSFHRGAVHVVQLPDEGQLASYTTAVAENNHLLLPDPALPAGPPPALLKAEKTAIPRRAGEPSLIEHVVYIIKENLTYDQLFGDLPKGNGDPSRLTYGADIAPNHRQLAQQFVLLDNIYSNGGNSGDGHQWLTQANETAYCWWPGYRGRGYPYDGSDPLAPARAGFIWDLALMMKKSVRVYGEYVARYPLPGLDRKRLLDEWTAGTDFSGRWQVRSPIRRLDSVLARHYPPFIMDIPDVVRAQIFLSDLKQWERDGTMPNLVILQLPCDHGYGTKPGVTTPAATMADNDLALGQIVEALTKTRFWRKLAIFVIQDDPGGGLDHVDGYRTAAQIISPYARRGTVDSTFYSQVSVLKTIELILGLPTLSLYDMIANDFRNSFMNTPDFTGYTAVVPKQDLSEVNPPLKALKGPALKAAVDSMKMKFDVPDAIPQDRLSRIVWHSIRGWNTPYPSVKRALFTPGSLNLEDDEREEAER